MQWDRDIWSWPHTIGITRDVFDVKYFDAIEMPTNKFTSDQQNKETGKTKIATIVPDLEICNKDVPLFSSYKCQKDTMGSLNFKKASTIT